MSYVIAVPEALTAAAIELEGIGSALSAATVAGPVPGVMPAAADEVSTAIAALFSTCAKEYQAVNAQAAAFHAQFVQVLTAGAGGYAGAEAANTSLLQIAEQEVLRMVNAPT